MICKQFVSNAKSRKKLKPCRGFKSFRSLVFDYIFGKNGSFHSSFLSTQWNAENGSMKLWKKVGAKKREKSLEISRFLLFSRSDLFWPIMMAGAGGFEPATHGFGDRYSTSWAIPLYCAFLFTLVIISHIFCFCNSFLKYSFAFFELFNVLFIIYLFFIKPSFKFWFIDGFLI